MDYKQKYEEALLKAQQLLEDDPEEALNNDDLLYIFPELKESEDERIKKILLDFLKNELEKHGNEEWDGGFHTTDMIAWFEKQGKQKPAWSEEDEIGLGDALWCCKQVASIAKDENDMGNVWYAERWLKSLRPQKQWKPTELQIEALESATENCAYSEYQDCLRELLEQLKKL